MLWLGAYDTRTVEQLDTLSQTMASNSKSAESTLLAATRILRCGVTALYDRRGKLAAARHRALSPPTMIQLPQFKNPRVSKRSKAVQALQKAETKLKRYTFLPPSLNLRQVTKPSAPSLPELNKRKANRYLILDESDEDDCVGAFPTASSPQPDDEEILHGYFNTKDINKNKKYICDTVADICDTVTNAPCNALTVDDKIVAITSRGRKRKARTIFVSYSPEAKPKDAKAAAAAAALKRSSKRSKKKRSVKGSTQSNSPGSKRRRLREYSAAGTRRLEDFFTTTVATSYTDIPDDTSPGDLGNRVGIGTVVLDDVNTA
jgi:hypothetical protein